MKLTESRFGTVTNGTASAVYSTGVSQTAVEKAKALLAKHKYQLNNGVILPGLTDVHVHFREPVFRTRRPLHQAVPPLLTAATQQCAPCQTLIRYRIVLTR